MDWPGNLDDHQKVTSTIEIQHSECDFYLVHMKNDWIQLLPFIKWLQFSRGYINGPKWNNKWHSMDTNPFFICKTREEWEKPSKFNQSVNRHQYIHIRFAYYHIYYGNFVWIFHRIFWILSFLISLNHYIYYLQYHLLSLWKL